MRLNKQIRLGIFLLVGLLLISFTSASYMRSNIKYTQFDSQKSFWEFDKSMCEAGQDFILQIVPFGCTPSVVRSDLLEEQNVPVFCQIGATKINPLIEVEAIESISFTGEYPEEVAGIGFHPARAALGVKSNLNSPVLNNIGYVVIVLKKQKNESAMPEFVQGNLTAKIKYDIKNAFGIGKANFYLPELTDDEWGDTYNQYGFWNGRFFLRADGIDDGGATISIYDDTKRISSVNLKKGEISRNIYLPGFDCLAGLRLRLNGLENPDTRAKLRVNADVVEVAEGEKFLESKCSIPRGGIEKQGIVQRVTIRCNEDEAGFFGGKPFNLIISPKVKLDFEGANEEGYEVGDYLYETQGRNKKFVYFGYAGTRRDTGKEEDLYVYLVAILQQKDKLSRSEISSMALHDKLLRPSTDTEAGAFWDTIIKGYEIYVGTLIRIGEWAVKGEQIKALRYSKEESFLGKEVKIIGFAEPLDEELDDEIEKYYDLATEDYETILDSFAMEKHPEDEKVTFGELALLNKTKLAGDLGQKRTILELCEEFKASYSDSLYKDEVKDCYNQYKLSSSEISSKHVLINGVVKKISFDGIYEPSLDEYSAEILVRGPNGKIMPFTLGKNQIKYLDDFRDPEEKIFYIYSGGIYSLYLVYDSNKWHWSIDKIVWVDVSKTKVEGGYYYNTEEDINLINSLQNKNFEDGKRILLDNEAVLLGITEFIQLISIDEDSVKINIHVRGVRERLREIFITETKVLKKDLTEGVGEYVFTLRNVNLKKFAKVSVIPNIDNVGTEANFSFKVGIEKRAIQLSPEKTKERIEKLDGLIEEWEGKSESLGKVVKGFKTACLGVSAVLTVKNFFANVGGKAIARQNVMRGEGGWYELCTDLVKQGKYDSIEECMIEEADNIDKDVEEYYKNMEEQNDEIKKIQEEFTEKKFLSESVVNTDKFMQIYVPDVQKHLKENFGASFEDPDNQGEPIDMNKMISSLSYDSWKNYSNYNKEQLRDIELYAGIYNDQDASPELKEMAGRRLYSEFSNIQEASENYADRANLASDWGISSRQIGFLEIGEYAKELSYDGVIYANIKNKIKISGINEDVPIKILQTSRGDKYIIVLDDSSGTNILPIKKNEEGNLSVYDLNGNLVPEGDIPQELKNVYFRKYDRTSYQNKFKASSGETTYVVRYYETEPYKGLPAVVPFDLDNGWYAATKPTLPVSGNIKPYDESGMVTSFWLCNVGENGIEEFRSGIGDDICEMINKGTGQPYNQFFGLGGKEAIKRVRAGEKAIEQASRQYKSGVSKVNIKVGYGNLYLKVGRPAADIPDMQCQDFMSPKDCHLLFNVCDPVVCPSSRCDFGGAYPVRDVIQSGIIGSIVLCLPNFREKIHVPVCLSGIKAGIDSYLSVLTSHRDCLQHSLDTGEMIGICDEIYSIYLCEFFWRQALPLARILLPKMIEFAMGQNIHGGGEYLGVASAWSNAEKSVNYFTQYYAANSYKAFKARTTEDVGSLFCKMYVSGVYPEGGNLLDALTEPDSPSQFHGWFDEIPFTSVTVPAISHYKVFYHIFAGKDSGAYYQVYLKGATGVSFYQDTGRRFVASGYIPAGEYASETKDFTAPSGYKEMCINVNGQEECGFKQVSTSFAVEYVKEKYIASQAQETDIKTEKECIAGSASVYGLLTTPNLQAGAEAVINPEIYNRGIIRICATDNPGKGTDSNAGGEGSRWVEVGYCGDRKIKCWLDTESVEDVIKHRDIEEDVLEKVTENQLEILRNREGYISHEEFLSEIEKIKGEKDSNNRIDLVNEIFDKVFFNSEKAHLFFLRGNAYGELAIMSYRKIMGIEEEEKEEEEEKTPFDKFIQYYQKCDDYAFGPCSCGPFDYNIIPDDHRIELNQEENKVLISLWEKTGLFGYEKTDEKEIKNSILCVYVPSREAEKMEVLQEFKIEKKEMDHGEGVIFSHEGNIFLMKYDQQHTCFPIVNVENYQEFMKLDDCEGRIEKITITDEQQKRIDDIINGKEELPSWPWVEDAGKLGEDPSCAQYCREAAKELFDLNYHWAHAWCREVMGDTLIWEADEMSVYEKSSTQQEQILQDNNYKLKELEEAGKLTPGMIVGAYYPKSSYKQGIKDECYEGGPVVTIYYTHNLLYLGKNDNDEMVFAELFSQGEPSLRTLDEFERHDLIAMAVFDAPDKLDKEVSEEKSYVVTSVNLKQENGKVILEVEHGCDSIDYEIMSDRLLWFDKEVGKGEVDVTKEFNIDEFEVGKKYYAKVYCIKEGKIIKTKRSDMLTITEPELEEQKEAQGGIDNEVIKEDCEDGIDNDLDGYIDCADTECRGILLPPQNVIFSTSKIKIPFFKRFKFDGGSSGGGGAERPLDLCQYKPTGISIPRPINFVSDYAKVVDDDSEDRLNDILSSLKGDKGIEIAIVSMFSVDRGIKQVAREVFDEWKIGENDKGILIIFSLKSEVVRIEVGYGLDYVITDGDAGAIIDEELIGNLDEDDIESALLRTVNAINNEIEGS